MRENIVKKKIKEGKPVFGTFVRLNSISVEIFGLTGWDFVIIDVEHGVHDFQDISNMIRAAKASGTYAIVRVPGTAPINIMRSLDAGADGVEVPQITNLEQVKEACESAKYYPKGHRGSCGYNASIGYSTIPLDEHIKTSNENVMMVLHIENAWAAEHIEEILDQGEIDVIFCGPYDMSQSLGIPGQINDKRVTDLVEKVFDVCKKRGVGTGIFVKYAKDAKPWLEKGTTFIACSVDSGIFADAAKAEGDCLRKQIEELGLN